MTFFSKNKNDAALKNMQDFFLVLSKCWLSIVMLFAGAYAFLMNDQGQDIVTAFNESRSLGMSAATALCMLFWGIESWFGARMAQNLSDTTALNDKQKIKLAVLLPRILGFLSMLVFYISYLIFKEIYWTADLIILFLPFIIYWLVVVKRRKLADKINKLHISEKVNLQIEIKEITNEAIEYTEIPKSAKRFFKLPLVLFPLLVAVIAIFPVVFPSSCSPTVIILLGIAIWTGLATAITVFEKMHKIPLVLITAVLVYFFSFINNNHEVRKTESVNNPISIDSALNRLIGQLPDSTKTIYIVCGEGGGIRAAYWTASVLASLTDSVPAFSKHLFALSTVSGSSLGASAYNAILKYGRQNEAITNQVRCFMKEDYLSPVAAAFMFNDALQRLLPFPVGHFDRARYLEWSWEAGWAKNFDNTVNPFAQPMNNLWDNNSTLPNLFLNSTHTESGRRAVVSNLVFNQNAWQSNNVGQLIGNDMPLSSSTLLSARFPVLTPGAKISDSVQNYWGTLVDGGYYDNYGAITAFDIYNDIRKVYKPSELKVVVLMILNSDYVPQNPKPIKSAYEVLTVPTTFLNTWTVSPEKSLNMLNDILVANNDTLVSIMLSRNKKENLPLGWYLSNKAMNIMDNQLKSAKWLAQKKQILELMQ